MGFFGNINRAIFLPVLYSSPVGGGNAPFSLLPAASKTERRSSGGSTGALWAVERVKDGGARALPVCPDSDPRRLGAVYPG